MAEDAEHPVEACLDYPELLARMENDQDLVRDLLRIFKDEFPRGVQSLREAIASGDLKKIETTGHTMKGMAAMLAFGRVTQLCKQIEMLGRQRIGEGLAELVAGLEHETRLAVAALESSCVEPPQ